MVLTHLVLFNFFHGATLGESAPVVVAHAATPSGVRRGRKRELIVQLKDVESRESTAEFLKSQLRLRQGITDPVAPPTAPRETRAQRLSRERMEKRALEGMEIERKNEERRILTEQNNAVLALLMIGSQ